MSELNYYNKHPERVKSIKYLFGESAKYGSWEVTIVDGAIVLKSSDYFAEMIGFEEDVELTWEKYTALFTPQDALGADDLIRGVMLAEPGLKYQVQHRIYSQKDNCYQWYEFYAHLCQDDDGFKYILGDTFFVGDRVMFQDSIEQDNMLTESITTLFEKMPLVANYWSNDKKLIETNEKGAKMFGLSSKSEYIERFDELSPEFQPDGSNSMQKALDNLDIALTEGFCEFEWLHQFPDGRPVPTLVTLIRAEGSRGQIVAGYTRDLSEIKKLERKALRERELMQTVLDTCPVAFNIVIDHNIVETNSVAQALLNIQVGMHSSKILIEEPQREEIYRRVENNEIINWRPVSVADASNQPRDMLMCSFPIDYYQEHGKNANIVWFVDVHEIRKTERELVIARDAAEENAKAKTQFLANMSHEIRTPMNAIVGMSDLMSTGKLDEEQRASVDLIKKSSRSLLRIFDDVLAFSKIDANDMVIQKREFSLNEFIDELRMFSRLEASGKDIDIKIDVKPYVPSSVVTDERQLKKALENVLENAIKFTKKGYVSLTVDAEKQLDKTKLLFEIEDTGIGIPEEMMSVIFEEFVQVDDKKITTNSGTGLGLPIAKRILDLIDGEISVATGLRKGSVFTIAVNVVDANKGAIADTRVRRNKKVHQFGSLIVKDADMLVVDDSKINLQVATKILNRLGANIDQALSGREAVEMVKLKHYDLIFMDQMMPEMDGIEATQHIRNDGFTGPIAALTANAVAGAREMLLAAGMDEYLTKPIEIDPLCAVLIKHLPPEKVVLLDNGDADDDYLEPAGYDSFPKQPEAPEEKQPKIVAKNIPNNCKFSKQIYDIIAFRNQDEFDLIAETISSIEAEVMSASNEYLAANTRQLVFALRVFNEDFVDEILPDYIDALASVSK